MNRFMQNSIDLSTDMYMYVLVINLTFTGRLHSCGLKLLVFLRNIPWRKWLFLSCWVPLWWGRSTRWWKGRIGICCGQSNTSFRTKELTFLGNDRCHLKQCVWGEQQQAFQLPYSFQLMLPRPYEPEMLKEHTLQPVIQNKVQTLVRI